MPTASKARGLKQLEMTYLSPTSGDMNGTPTITIRKIPSKSTGHRTDEHRQKASTSPSRKRSFCAVTPHRSSKPPFHTDWCNSTSIASRAARQTGIPTITGPHYHYLAAKVQPIPQKQSTQ
ncbi:unnamed protein product [Protopolystoma xenopodis]|uniref:Uncharacterized protein n=1 Tax=Protopolystoma xenopodis TaxID=117903 RepID=A0A3S5FH81_9PLAT|nr:unnamed protein product [Protopolystoma xenopodis]